METRGRRFMFWGACAILVVILATTPQAVLGPSQEDRAVSFHLVPLRIENMLRCGPYFSKDNEGYILFYFRGVRPDGNYDSGYYSLVYNARPSEIEVRLVREIPIAGPRVEKVSFERGAPPVFVVELTVEKLGEAGDCLAGSRVVPVTR